ncbi:PPE domain-containing protein [Gordonia sp. ABSL1-1]|uniref:PPE domain-containing protein n=1 Tax=Gordonia sp. ABSL1-1 TaxID=3053923 RepID=UPI0025733F1A|nr:PPE domain-containing protein [Gordonia sp. ABSL1-1]MDL9936714.1 PPE domain-containing protein [Gordonia sp. ABSL1-1]
MTGFTGVVWDARTTRQLTADLTDGRGPGPLAEAGQAWTMLSEELARAGADYGAVLGRLGVQWDSPHAKSAIDALTGLLGWFADAAAAAARNAAHAEAQAAATAVARVSMPDTAEVELVDSLHDLVATASAVAPLIGGAAAHVERALHQQRMRAARVMSMYETATEPAATPWHSPLRAPAVASDVPLRLAEARNRTDSVHLKPGTTPDAPTTAGVAGYRPTPVQKQAYVPTRLAATSPTPPPHLPEAEPAGGEGHPAAPVVPPGATGAGAGAGADRSIRVADRGAGDAAQASAAVDVPSTWAEVAVSDRPVIGPVVDPRYFTETLLLGQEDNR